jgi:hypothetical protein
MNKTRGKQKIEFYHRLLKEKKHKKISLCIILILLFIIFIESVYLVSILNKMNGESSLQLPDYITGNLTFTMDMTPHSTQPYKKGSEVTITFILHNIGDTPVRVVPLIPCYVRGEDWPTGCLNLVFPVQYRIINITSGKIILPNGPTPHSYPCTDDSLFILPPHQKTFQQITIFIGSDKADLAERHFSMEPGTYRLESKYWVISNSTPASEGWIKMPFWTGQLEANDILFNLE